jgi:AcrR family transcriptional regulator
MSTVNLMEKPVKTRRYDASKRRAHAAENKRAILEAAKTRFLTHGYARTSIASVAADAGVSEDLVYKHFANKRGLVVEVLNYAVTGRVDSPRVLQQERPRAVFAEPDQRRQLAMFAEDISGRVARARPVDDVIRSAGEVDPALAEKHASMHRTRFRNLQRFVDALASHGPLRDGLDAETAAATVWALCSPDVHRMLVEGLGWEQEQYAAWLHETLESSLLPPR